MPHLSPMNWLLSLLAFWTILLISSSSYWWSQNNKFISPKFKSHSSILNLWKW